MKKVAVIVAGGSGTRMGGQLPKQFMSLHSKPIFLHAIDAFRKAFTDIEVILVLPEVHVGMAMQILEDHQAGGGVRVVKGGETRFHSVKNGLSGIHEDAIVFVHDAVRCLVQPSLIKRCEEAVVHFGSAIPVIPVRDSIRKKTATGSTTVSRENLFVVQTPQAFYAQALREAFSCEYNDTFTDEAAVFEANGGEVHLVEGDRTNIKITFPEDLSYAEWLMSGQV